MKIPIFQVDAFCNGPFTGNPAAVCPLEDWLPDKLMQAIAEQNNLSETAFTVKDGDCYSLRWFTPVAEVDLCGHATLAAAHVLFHELKVNSTEVEFMTRSGKLAVTCNGGILTMDFPSIKAEPFGEIGNLEETLGVHLTEAYLSMDYMVILGSEDLVAGLTPDFAKIKSLGMRGVIVTAPGNEVDFVSRFFAPAYGIDEDPVTGSAHCMLAPYWAQKTGKSVLEARQLSRRGGWVRCAVEGQRVLLSGRASLYLTGEITI